MSHHSDRFIYILQEIHSCAELSQKHTKKKSQQIRLGTTRFTPHLVSRRPLVRVLKSRVSDNSPSSLVGTGGLRLDIERLFAKKLRIFGDVQMDRESLTSAILRLVLKTYFECVRLTHFCRTSSLTRILLYTHYFHIGTHRYVFSNYRETDINKYLSTYIFFVFSCFGTFEK